MSLRRCGLGLLFLLALIGLAACGESNDKPLVRVFEAPPWSGDETLQYDLVLRDGKTYGHCQLEVRQQADGPDTQLNRRCGDGQNEDNGSVVVEPSTLIPRSAHREVIRPEKDDRWTYDTTYAPPSVKFVANTNGNVHQTTRELAKPSAKSPDPGYYDDESLLWLVRGVPLREGYEGSYQNVNASTGRVFTVDLKVEKPETVEVRGGTFTAWKIRISSSVTNLVWVETEAPHRVIRARFAGLEDVTYELAADQGQ